MALGPSRTNRLRRHAVRRLSRWRHGVTGRADRWIRRTTIGCVGMLARIAGTVSYLHMHLLADLHGQPGWVAALTTLSVDGSDVEAAVPDSQRPAALVTLTPAVERTGSFIAGHAGPQWAKAAHSRSRTKPMGT